MAEWRLRVVVPTFNVSDDHSFNVFLNTPYSIRMTGAVGGDSPVSPSDSIFKDPEHYGWVISRIMRDRRIKPTELIPAEKKWTVRERLKYEFLKERFKDCDAPIGA